MANTVSGLNTADTKEEYVVRFKIECMESNGYSVMHSSQSPSIHRHTTILGQDPDPVHIKIEPISLPPQEQSLSQAQSPIDDIIHPNSVAPNLHQALGIQPTYASDQTN